MQVRGHTTIRGLIPAHAGSTGSASHDCGPRPAHPRSRGEHGAGVDGQLGARGSSPLTRGALMTGRCLIGLWGLIPAHAGSTSEDGVTKTVDRAHPRSRGEHM